MLRRVLIFLVIIFLLCPAIAAYADAIAAPDNDFYYRNSNECVFLGRNFQANGPDGVVPVQKAPGSGGKIAAIENGETQYVLYSCLYKGEYWGLATVYKEGPPERYIDGWVKMDQLLVLYDFVAFDEDHQSEFYQYEGNYDEIEEAGGAIVWAWPGSGDQLWTVEGLDTENFWVSAAWKDDQGREWGFVSYLYGSRNIWVCLSEPMNSDISAFNPAPEPAPWVSETTHTDIGKSGAVALPVIIIILVAAVAIVTVILIRVFWKPGKGTAYKEGQ